MDPTMEEKFFIEEPERLENNFFSQEHQKKFQKEFKEKSQQMTKVLSQKHRHAKKMNKKRRKDLKVAKPN